METKVKSDRIPLDCLANQFIKRLLDIIISSLVLILIFPWLFIVVAIGQMIYMPGPVFFKQKRTGKNGKIFMCYKFRSMDAHNKSDVFVDPSKNKYSYGNILRSSSIDEIPQFWNVFKGDMSIIGPRPHMLIHDEEYRSVIKDYDKRYIVKPGITGWAQVHGLRGERAIERVRLRVEYDLWYIHNWSLWLDMKIMFRTVGVMAHRGK